MTSRKISNEPMKPIAFVLLSGGVDSSTCLAYARSHFEKVRAVSMDYGQRHSKEMQYAAKQCRIAGIQHVILPIKSIVPKTMLTDKKSKVPNISYDEIKGVSPTYVPFRNGLMISVLTSYIHGTLINESCDVEGVEHTLFFGAHAEDAKNWAYPDCTPEFVGAMANVVYVGSYRRIRLSTPLLFMSKDEVVTMGEKYNVNWANTWSCYKGEALHCGICPTCRARQIAFAQAGVKDPTQYANKKSAVTVTRKRS